VHPSIDQFAEQIYAGVLGKAIGVYFGRPVEGWSYDRIRARFGEVAFYVAEEVGAPLVVPDDDISGTFVFYRSLEDNGYSPDLSAAEIGDTWLNYIVENKTILWWGGLSRSTEHTAYLRLKSGIRAPQSGSLALNGRSMAEQIGAEIFIDTWALANPGDPERAVALARRAASVSHDGLAVEAACLLAAMEALAFCERRLDRLLADGLRFVGHERLLRLVDGVVEQCQRYPHDWRLVRDWIARYHGYDKYPGNCPMATNHASVIMALLLGGDDFQRALTIATSSGWDTDCNAGNVGCLNGIRLGLDALDAGAKLRPGPADQLYVVNADGGECITDTVQQTRRLLATAAALRGEQVDLPSERFAFEYRGSTQGFTVHPGLGLRKAVTAVENALAVTGEPGLLIRYAGLAKGVLGVVSVKTFVDPEPKGQKGTSYFEVIASPSLYATQLIRARVKGLAPENPSLRFFIDFYDERDELATLHSGPYPLVMGDNDLEWRVPDTNGYPIYRVGLELQSAARLDGAVILRWLDWAGAPACFRLGRSMEMSPSLTPWTTVTPWTNAFVSSAQNFAPDYTTTFSISHPGANGIVTIGTRDWRDYAVSSGITFSQQRAAGLVARIRGHRRYYAAILSQGQASIIKRRDAEVLVLCSVPFAYALDNTYNLEFRVCGTQLALVIDGQECVRTVDADYASGGAGFLVEEGALLCDGFAVCKIE
jgi:ADP-ribosylglycohydrolase